MLDAPIFFVILSFARACFLFLEKLLLVLQLCDAMKCSRFRARASPLARRRRRRALARSNFSYSHNFFFKINSRSTLNIYYSFIHALRTACSVCLLYIIAARCYRFILLADRRC